MNQLAAKPSDSHESSTYNPTECAAKHRGIRPVVRKEAESMKAKNRKLLDFTANPDNPKRQPRERRQTNIHHHLAQRGSINDCCALLGVTRFACELRRDREQASRPAVAIARHPQRGNPDKPYKTIHADPAPKPLQNQRDRPIQAPHRSTTEFFNNPDKTLADARARDGSPSSCAIRSAALRRGRDRRLSRRATRQRTGQSPPRRRSRRSAPRRASGPSGWEPAHR